MGLPVSLRPRMDPAASIQMVAPAACGSVHTAASSDTSPQARAQRRGGASLTKRRSDYVRSMSDRTVFYGTNGLLPGKPLHEKPCKVARFPLFAFLYPQPAVVESHCPMQSAAARGYFNPRQKPRRSVTSRRGSYFFLLKARRAYTRDLPF
jgi:hypothetical protein